MRFLFCEFYYFKSIYNLVIKACAKLPCHRVQWVNADNVSFFPFLHMQFLY